MNQLSILIIGALVLPFATYGQQKGQVRLEGEPEAIREHLVDVPGELQLQGQAWTDVWADKGLLSIRLATIQDSLELAVRMNDTLHERLVGVLTTAGIAADRIKKDPFVALPLESKSSTRAQQFRVERVLRVDVRTSAEFTHVSHAVNTVNDAKLGYVEYEFPDEDAQWLVAVGKALAVIKAKKDTYEKALNVELSARDILEERFVQERPWMKNPVGPTTRAPGVPEPAVKRTRTVASARLYALVTVKYTVHSR